MYVIGTHTYSNAIPSLSTQRSRCGWYGRNGFRKNTLLHPPHADVFTKQTPHRSRYNNFSHFFLTLFLRLLSYISNNFYDFIDLFL
jgi:hypothetical protein